jgi:ribonuclease E
MRLWDDIREHTMQSVAPALIYEEASLIKRAIRDVYSRDIDEIWSTARRAGRRRAISCAC